MFLHEVAAEDLSFTKEDMHAGKHAEYERKLHDQMNTELKAVEQAKKRAQIKHQYVLHASCPSLQHVMFRSPEPSTVAKPAVPTSKTGTGKTEKSSSSSSVKSKAESIEAVAVQNVIHQNSSDTASDRSRSASRARETSPAASDQQVHHCWSTQISNHLPV